MHPAELNCLLYRICRIIKVGVQFQMHCHLIIVGRNITPFFGSAKSAFSSTNIQIQKFKIQLIGVTARSCIKYYEIWTRLTLIFFKIIYNDTKRKFLFSALGV